MLQNYSNTYTGGETKRIPLNGASYIRCTTGAVAFSIRVFKGSTLIMVASTWQAGLMAGPLSDIADFMEVTNGSTAQTIEIYAGDAPIVDGRIAGSIFSKSIGENTFDTSGMTSINLAAATAINTAVTNGGSCVLQNIGTADVCISGSSTYLYGAGTTLKAASSYLSGDGGSISVSAGIQWFGKTAGGATSVSFNQAKYT